MEYHLKQLSRNDGRDVYDLLQELPDDENGFKNPMYKRSFEDYKQWLGKCEEDAKKTELDDVSTDADFDDGWGVPKSIFWLYVEGRPVGMGKIRYYLTEALKRDGGHIGYSIRQGERGKGYGTLILQELVKEARRLNIDKLLLTIEPENEASIRVALSQGGTIEKTENGWSYIWVDC